MSDRVQPFTLLRPQSGPLPLLVSIPHTGIWMPREISRRIVSESARALPDTDWHLQRLYAFALRMGATILHANANRYVVDLNRPRDAKPLYPGRKETGLVPLKSFAGEALYASGDEPGADEIEQRVREWWDPYHACLTKELARLKERFGLALLFEAHSIASVVPDFFEGQLPDLVLGDAKGTSASASIISSVRKVQVNSDYDASHNHPFQGGYITRAYGRPTEGIHALQLEMAQRTYMQEGPPFAYDERLASTLQPVLEETLEAFVAAGMALV